MLVRSLVQIHFWSAPQGEYQAEIDIKTIEDLRRIFWYAPSGVQADDFC